MDVALARPDVARLVWAHPPGAAQLYVAAQSELYPTLRELVLWVPLCAGALLAGKVAVETWVLRPLARAALPGLKGGALPFVSPALEEAYRAHRPQLPDINAVKQLSGRVGKPVEELNRWFRAREAGDREQVRVRGCAESLFRLVAYGCVLAYNVWVLRGAGAAWARGGPALWEGLPLQESDFAARALFVCLQLPLYVVLLLAQVTDGRRARDMWEMTAHHVLVLALLSTVYLGNFLRIGMLGLVLHDVTDLLLEASKLANLFKQRGLADALFFAFAASWAYSRLYRFSQLVLSAVVAGEGGRVIGPILNALYAMIGLLFVLNLYWFKKIGSLLYRLLWAGAGKERAQRENTDLSTDDDVDSDSSYMSDADAVAKRHQD